MESTEAPVAVRPRAKSRARSVSIAETVFYPEEEEPAPKRRGRPRKQPILPTYEAAAQIEEEAKAPRARASVDQKPRVRKVALKTSLEKRPRGRPKGSLGKKKRDALLEEELRRLAAVEV